jgi:XTP/dITP diphosphohydrolase
MSRRALVIGTNNKDKRREIQKLLEGEYVDVLSLADFPKTSEAVEDGKTFEANARKKAKHYSTRTGLLTLADDSGLMVHFLKGKPGVYSARFAGPGCTYQDNNQKLLRLLKDVPESRRRARFVSVMALYDRGKFVAAVKGECRGRIAYSAKGGRGFGYDPVFIPEGFRRTFAQFSSAQKNRISHRGRALRKVKPVILRYFKQKRVKTKGI